MIRGATAMLRARALPLFALMVLVAWIEYLRRYVPSVSRGDFFLAILREDADVGAGRWSDAIVWPFEILGGHIVFYERVLQLVNYYLFSYSPVFVKTVALGAWVLLAVGLWRFARRLPVGRDAQAGALLALAVISFNPIPWETLAWPDATVPYLSSLIALLFALPYLVRVLDAPSSAGHGSLFVFLCLVVIMGSGVGWAIIPTVMWLMAVASVTERRYARLKVMALVAAVLIGLAAALILLFPRALRLSLVTESLGALPQNFDQFLGYFFSLFATLFGLRERPFSSWVGAGFFIASFAVYLLYKRRFRKVTEEEILYIFGLGSVLLVTLGRWKLNVDRGAAVTYYHLFALPAFYGAIVMSLRLLPAGVMGTGGVAAAAVLVSVMAPQLGFYHHNLQEQSTAYQNMIPAVRGWRMTEATRLIGSPGHNEDIFFDYLPRLKAQGRYRQLSDDYHPYRSSRIAPPRTTTNPRSCSQDYRNLEVFDSRTDDRAAYTQGTPQQPFHRFVGAARNGFDCEQGEISISLVDAAGVVQCKSWTTLAVYWHYDVPQHSEILRSPYAFDFSCPMEAGEYFLVTQDSAGHVLETVKVAR